MILFLIVRLADFEPDDPLLIDFSFYALTDASSVIRKVSKLLVIIFMLPGSCHAFLGITSVPCIIIAVRLLSESWG